MEAYFNSRVSVFGDSQESILLHGASAFKDEGDDTFFRNVANRPATRRHIPEDTNSHMYVSTVRFGDVCYGDAEHVGSF